VKIAPTNPRILAALADAYTELGEEERAKDAARRAFENAEGLPRDGRLSIESLYRRATKERQRVVEIGRALVTFFPDDIEHGLRFGQAQTAVGDRAGALATVEALRKLPPPGGTDPRIDLLEWEAEYTLGDMKRAREAAARAVATGHAKGARRLVALGRYDESLALTRLNELSAAKLALTEAQQLFHEVGDRSNEARTLTKIAAAQTNSRLAQPQFEAAIFAVER